MTAALAAQQRAFVAALLAATHEDAIAQFAGAGVLEATPRWRRGLLAYRSNADALAPRALAGAYPVIAQMAGPANFGHFARELWRMHPPRRGDVAQWGGEFAAWLESQRDVVQAEPCLPDVARVEWQLHVAATAADAQPDVASLALLAQADPARLCVDLAPGTAVVDSRHPVASLVRAHVEGIPSIETVAERVQAGIAEAAIVWRRGLRPCVRAALDGEAPFIAALQEGRPLADSLDTAPGLDAAAWLSLAVHSGLLVRVRRA